MKKILLIIGCLVTFAQAKAQIALSFLNDTPISNGQVVTYNNTDLGTATLYFKIKNTTASTIAVRFKITNIVNATGSAFQVCYFPECIPFVSVNQVFPPVTKPPITIAANSSTTGDGYNLHNFDTGNGVNYPIDYVLKFYAVDGNNNEVGTPFNLTYRYDPNAMAVNDVAVQDGFAKILNSKIGSNLTVSSKEKAQYQIHNAEGKLVLSGEIKAGNNNIDTGILKNGLYLISIRNSQGSTINGKLLK